MFDEKKKLDVLFTRHPMMKKNNNNNNTVKIDILHYDVVCIILVVLRIGCGITITIWKTFRNIHSIVGIAVHVGS